MTPSPPINLTIATNRIVFEYIKNYSAHPDLVDLLLVAVKPLEDVQISYPNSVNYSSVAISTCGIIFAFAIGMGSINFRLDNLMKEQAIAIGGMPSLKLGQEWIAFEPFHYDWRKVDLAFWARKAYVFVRATSL